MWHTHTEREKGKVKARPVGDGVLPRKQLVEDGCGHRSAHQSRQLKPTLLTPPAPLNKPGTRALRVECGCGVGG